MRIWGLELRICERIEISEDMMEDLADDVGGLEDEVGLWRQEGELEDLDWRSE